MKEEKIIELLKKCANYTDCMLKCPCCGGWGGEAVKLDKEALQLILRLQAENKLLNEKIERLENDIKVSKAKCCSLDHEIAQLKTEMNFYRSEYDFQFEANQRLIAEKERLTEELEHQKAIASAELDSKHKLGDDYAKVLEDEQKHIREAKIEAVKEFGKMLMDKCCYGVICAEDILETVVDYMNGECDEG